LSSTSSDPQTNYITQQTFLRISIGYLCVAEMITRLLSSVAISSAAPQIWNHIPAAIKVSPSLDSFKRHLKTHYFTSP